jgi:hypothetical protein
VCALTHSGFAQRIVVGFVQALDFGAVEALVHDTAYWLIRPISRGASSIDLVSRDGSANIAKRPPVK